MTGGLSIPDNVRDVGGCMIECSHTNTRIVRGCQKCKAGTEAGAYDAQLLGSMLFEPIETATNVNYALPCGIESTPDVRGTRIVRTPDFCRHADVVVRHRQSQHGNSQPIEGPTERCVSQCV